jgi:hypothetical protein
MLTRADFVVYLLYFAALIFSLLMAGLLFRVRAALFGLPRAQRRLVTILVDANLVWCLTMVLTGTTLIVRVLGYTSQPFTRYGILGALVVGSGAGLARLGHWFVWDDGGRVKQSAPVAGRLSSPTRGEAARRDDGIPDDD